MNEFDVRYKPNYTTKVSSILGLDDVTFVPKWENFHCYSSTVKVKGLKRSLANLLGHVISVFLKALFVWADSSVIPVIPVISVRWSGAAPLTAPCEVSSSRSLTVSACRELMGDLAFNALKGSHTVWDNNNNNNNNNALIGGLHKSSSSLGCYLQTISWNMARMRFGDLRGFILWMWPKAQWKSNC